MHSSNSTMTVSVQCYTVEHSSRHLLAEAQETGRHKEIMFTSSKGRVQMLEIFVVSVK